MTGLLCRFVPFCFIVKGQNGRLKNIFASAIPVESRQCVNRFDFGGSWRAHRRKATTRHRSNHGVDEPQRSEGSKLFCFFPFGRGTQVMQET